MAEQTNTSSKFSATMQVVKDFFHVNPGETRRVQTPKESDNESVFDLGYIPTSKAIDYSLLTSGYFTVDDFGLPAIAFGGTEDAGDIFWQIIVTGLSELHEEKYALHNTISDSVAIFAAGAKPIAITINGYVLLSASDDEHYRFLQSYVDKFRARLLSAQEKKLTFRSQDTAFKLIIDSIALSRDVALENYVGITVSGLAYEYTQTDSLERLDLSYYGKKRKTKASAIELDEEDEEKKEMEQETNKEEAAKPAEPKQETPKEPEVKEKTSKNPPQPKKKPEPAKPKPESKLPPLPTALEPPKPSKPTVQMTPQVNAPEGKKQINLPPVEIPSGGSRVPPALLLQAFPLKLRGGKK